MNLEEIILDFDRYAKINAIFDCYRKKVEKFVKIHPLEKILHYEQDIIYRKGEPGKNSYLRVMGNEDLMGTRIGQIYTGYHYFFNPVRFKKSLR